MILAFIALCLVTTGSVVMIIKTIKIIYENGVSGDAIFFLGFFIALFLLCIVAISTLINGGM